MYCQYCGTKNDDNARFCEGCGKPLEDSSQIDQTPTEIWRPRPAQIQPGHIPGRPMNGNQIPIQGWQTQGMTPPVRPAAQAPRKPMSRGTVIIMIEVVILLAIGFLCYNQIQTLSDPRTVVNSYMEAVAQQDWEKAYSYLKMPSLPFLSLESYQNYMEASDMKDITDYSVERSSKNSRRGSLISEYEVSYTSKTNASQTTIRVPLTRSREKKWKLIDDWKISLVDNLLNDVEISTAPMLEVRIDGVLLNGETADVEEAGDQVIYTVSNIFEGSHILEVSGPGMVPYRQEMTFLYDGDYKQLWIPYMSDEQLQTLGSKCADYWGKLMQGAVSGQEASDMPEELQNGYEDAVWMLSRSVDADYITHMDNKRPSVILNDFEYRNGKLQASVTMKTDLEVTGMAGGSSGYEQRTAKGVGMMNATYHYEDWEWILDTYDVSYSNN